MRHHPPLRRLVIKPTPGCTANCLGCRARRDLHRTFPEEPLLSLPDWRAILEEARSLGLRDLHISGGEPTLYADLPQLIQAGKNLGFRVRLNSNGSKIGPGLARELLRSGLDEVCISIYSHEPQVHDDFCRSTGLWRRATEATRILAELRREFPHFLLGTMSIILRENYRSFDQLVAFHRKLGSQQMGIAYLEGDFSRELLLDESELPEFRRDVVPRLVDFCRNLDASIRSRARYVLENLYRDSSTRGAELAQGKYWTGGYCSVPRSAGLIMANGEVHPCNIVEYTHEPVMGRVGRTPLTQIWHSESWSRYRSRLHERCEFCPVNLYRALPLASDLPSSWRSRAFHGRLLQPLRPVLEKLNEIYRRQKQGRA